MSKFTKGPWTVSETNNYLSIDAIGGPIISDWDINSDPSAGICVDPDTERANFTLIAASPDLYEACRYALKIIRHDDMPWWIDCPDKGGFDTTIFEAAVAKADKG